MVVVEGAFVFDAIGFDAIVATDVSVGANGEHMLANATRRAS